MKVSLLTLGCKVNQAEMSDIESSLRGKGHEIVGLADNPDICVVNTCTVTSKSDHQSRQLIRRAGRTGARVLVTGCYSELNKEKVGRMDGVQAVVDNTEKSCIISLIDSNSKSNTLSVAAGRTRYFLKVQDGCDNTCSYCIVPRARGSSRSVTPEKVIENINRAVESGYREVVLTGIHLGQYGNDIEGAGLSILVEKILEKTRVERLRLSSIEVNEVDDHLLSLFENPRLARHLHIPLQSGDDGVLKLMNRQYDAAYFRDTVMGIHEKLPGMALGTDIIAGFPQEGEDAFRRTLDLAEELPFTYVHVFPYSRRPGTPAALMKDIVGDSARKERAAALRALAGRKKKAYLNQQVGETLEVLIEERIEDRLFRGTSGNYLKVRVSGTGQRQGTIATVSIGGIVEGEPVGDIVNCS